MTVLLEKLTEEDALYAIENGEFSSGVLGASSRVAIILTQHWCPDWRYMEKWLADEEGDDEEPRITVYVLVYNKIPSFHAFRTFKEDELGNSLIPYVRYYRDGLFLGDSNRVSREEFLENFGS